MRILDSPSDIDNYPANQHVHRKFFLPIGHPQLPEGGEVVECRWGPHQDGEESHPAESVNFTKIAGGDWVKSTSLILD